MAEILLGLMLWIGDHSQHNVLLAMPNVIQINQYELCRRYGIESPQQCQNSELIGFFDKDITIYMPLDYKPDSLHKQSQLLHELVHYVQWQNMHSNEKYCLGNKEYEAYKLQNQWREQHGLAPVSDAFTLMMLQASCDD